MFIHLILCISSKLFFKLRHFKCYPQPTQHPPSKHPPNTNHLHKHTHQWGIRQGAQSSGTINRQQLRRQVRQHSPPCRQTHRQGFKNNNINIIFIILVGVELIFQSTLVFTML